MKEDVSYLEAVEKGLPFKAIDILHALCEDDNFKQNEEDKEVFRFILNELYMNAAINDIDLFNYNVIKCIENSKSAWHSRKEIKRDFIKRIAEVFANLILTIDLNVNKKCRLQSIELQ